MKTSKTTQKGLNLSEMGRFGRVLAMVSEINYKNRKEGQFEVLPSNIKKGQNRSSERLRTIHVNSWKRVLHC